VSGRAVGDGRVVSGEGTDSSAGVAAHPARVTTVIVTIAARHNVSPLNTRHDLPA